ncbi:MAG TPA: PAS domain S-box protein, partial [Ignavibacteria bacterium]|nr:PAS domain S-box protein [Ignavibacteria bacterium]
YVDKLDITLHEPEKGPIVRAFTDNTYYVSNDVENDPKLSRWKDDCTQKGFHSFGTFPLECRNKVIAVYNIYSGEKNFFGNESTKLLLELAEDISFALEYLEIEKERIKIEESYRNIVEKAPVGIWLQLDGRISYINPAGYRMLGYDSYHELVGRDIKEIIHSSSHREVNERIGKLLEGKPVPEIEEKFVSKNGRLLDVMVSAIPFAQDGRNGSQAFFNDLTETKKAQKDANETNERFKLITKATNDALWDWNLETNTIWWNDGFKDLFGYSDDEIGKDIESWTGRIHEDDKERIKSGIEMAISAGHDFWFDEYAFRRKDGSYSYVFDRGYILKDSAGKPYRMVGSMIDISFRRKMEEKLKASEEKWRSLFENSPSIILTIDGQYCITSVNRSVSRRYDSLEIIGLKCFELIDEADRPMAQENLDKVFNTGEAISFTVKRVSEDGTVQYYTVQAVPQKRSNTVEYITIIATDITEKILAEEKEKDTNEMLHSLA